MKPATTSPRAASDLTATPSYSWRLLRAGTFRLDGGSMFGLIPRSVWSRTTTPDDRGRIEVQHNCLLLERAGEGPGPKLVLIEAGTGDKMDAKSKEIFALTDRTVVSALHEVDCRPEDIGAAVVTHLHFDHAGGLTRRCRPGETPDWTPGSPSETPSGEPVKLTFPNASIHAQQREWVDALDNKSVMTRTYFRDHLEPIRDRIRPVDSPRPFPAGYQPQRDELPIASMSNRTTPLKDVPGVSVFLAPGHTWGQQAITFRDTKGRTVVYVPDVMPTAAHVGAAYSLGYDVEPYTSMISRHWLLDAASRDDWLLVLDHEAGNPIRRAKANSRGWYDLAEDQP